MGLGLQWISTRVLIVRSDPHPNPPARGEEIEMHERALSSSLTTTTGSVSGFFAGSHHPRILRLLEGQTVHLSPLRLLFGWRQAGHMAVDGIPLYYRVKSSDPLMGVGRAKPYRRLPRAQLLCEALGTEVGLAETHESAFSFCAAEDVLRHPFSPACRLATRDAVACRGMKRAPRSLCAASSENTAIHRFDASHAIGTQFIANSRRNPWAAVVAARLFEALKREGCWRLSEPVEEASAAAADGSMTCCSTLIWQATGFPFSGKEGPSR